jgi:type IV pilus assembly protein PilE
MIACCASPRRSAAGFTLIEVMVTLAIVGILAILAAPSFQDQIARSRRAEAKSALQMAALWMERNQAATFRYNQDPAGAAVTTTMLSNLGWGQTPPTGAARYLITFAAAPTAAGYVLAATPQGSQALADTPCGGPLAIDNIGQRGVLSGSTVLVNAASEACWQR